MEKQGSSREIDTNLLRLLPRKILQDYRIVPVRKEGRALYLLSDGHIPLPVLDDLQAYSGHNLEVEQASPEVINHLIKEYLDLPLDTVEGMLNDLEGVSLDEYINFELDTGVENLEELAREAPIIRLVNVIITTAIKKGASDIHIEPFEDKMKIRYRIDGYLYENPAPALNLLPALITRIKIMANLNIADRRLPQEGRIRIRVSGRELDIRVSIMPTLYGESAVLRLLDRAEMLLDIRNLGFAEEILERFTDLVRLPHGIILVTGPTGSGKTTTLYAALNELKSPHLKIITIEDPIEYQLDGINQIQVRPEINFTFARGLRSILRQDPDIIMVGEIRDVETATTAIQAALTGHLVLATLHTNDAAGAVTRLLDMGVQDYLLASTLKGVLAQRLVRVLCPNCKEPWVPDSKEASELGLEQGESIFRQDGCPGCDQLGFSGRTGIYELITVNEDLEALISRGVSAGEIRSAANRAGMKTLLADGREKVRQGITTIAEVIRVTRN